MMIHVVPREGVDAYKLLRSKVIHEAKTWYWKNRAKTRLGHISNADGFIDVGSAKGVLIAHVRPKEPAGYYFFAEKFIGRLIAWFRADLAAIHLHFGPVEPERKRRVRRKRTRKRTPKRR